MGKKYTTYTLDDLLLDDNFISSVLHPTSESKEFWDYLVQTGYVQADDLEKASLFIRAVQSPKEKMFRKEKDLLWEKIEIENKKNLKKKIRHLYLVCTSAVASVFLLLGVSIFLYWEYQSEASLNPMALLKKQSDMQGNTDIRLVLSEDKEMSFDEKNTDIQYDTKGDVKVNSRSVVDKRDEKAISKEEKKEEGKKDGRFKNNAIKYNQLIVPKGKHSTLLLSDGTKLWVNADSHVVFPVTFEKDKREIYVDGEVYLEVSRNETCPFIVKTNRMKVKVLGTSFNVKSYETDENNDVVLVTGSVQVKTEAKQEIVLTPNQRFSCKPDGAVNIEEVDVYDYICWKDGLLRYKSESLSTILRRLSDYYGKEIRWEAGLDDLKCSGKLDLKEDMEKVLNGLTKMIPVKYCKRDECYFFSMNH